MFHFTVNEITPPENDASYIQLKKALAKKAEMSVMGYDYQQERAFDVLDKAAANEGGASGMGMNLGNVFGGVMGKAMTNIPEEVREQPVNETIACAACGAKIPEGSKFCLECGTKVVMPKKGGMKICPRCKANVPEGKFCLECGARLELLCAKCKAKLIPGAKFCLECGQKV